MREILAKLGFPLAVGVYCDGRTVYVSRVASTPFGQIALDQFAKETEDGDEATNIARALDGLAPRCGRLRVALGLPTERCYLATRPVTSPGGAASPQVLLRESLRCGTTPVDKMTADVVTSRPDRRDVAGIAACDRGFLERLRLALDQGRTRLVHVEPAPCALLRLAQKEDRQRGKARVVVRLFLGKTQAMAVLTTDRQPIVWRTAPLPHGDEAAAIVALVRGLAPLAKPCGVERSPDAVVIHGRIDLERLVDRDWICQQVEIPLGWLDDPPLDGDRIALGLASGAFCEETEGFDLAREHRQPPRLIEIFPLRETALYVLLLLAMAGFMGYRKLQVDGACAAALISNHKSAVASVPTSELEKERKDLQARVSAVQRFLGSRVMWTAYLRELTSSLPDSVYLTSLSGDAELERPTKGKTAAKRSLVVKGAVTLPDSGLIPLEVDRVVNTIREHPLISKDFPVVVLTDLKQVRQANEDRESAVFSVMCLPKGTGKKK